MARQSLNMTFKLLKLIFEEPRNKLDDNMEIRIKGPDVGMHRQIMDWAVDPLYKGGPLVFSLIVEPKEGRDQDGRV